MTGDDTARLIYLMLLGAAVATWFFAQNRNSMGKTAQQAAVWGLIFIGTIAAVGLWGDIQRTVSPGHAVSITDGQIVLPRAYDGHYYLVAQVNGTDVEFVVDTGATDIVLSKSDARAAGINTDDLAYIGRAYTANGEVRTAPVRLSSLSIGPVNHYSIRAVVNDGEMDGSLLGMSYLQRFQITIANGKMVLTP